jgi:hypothetical protein
VSEKIFNETIRKALRVIDKGCREKRKGRCEGRKYLHELARFWCASALPKRKLWDMVPNFVTRRKGEWPLDKRVGGKERGGGGGDEG